MEYTFFKIYLEGTECNIPNFPLYLTKFIKHGLKNLEVTEVRLSSSYFTNLKTEL